MGKYIVFYRTEDGRNRFERVDAQSETSAKRKIMDKWHDITSIVDVREDK